MYKNTIHALLLFSFFSPAFATKFLCYEQIKKFGEIKDIRSYTLTHCYKREDLKVLWTCPDPQSKVAYAYESSWKNEHGYVTKKEKFYVPKEIFNNEKNWVNNSDDCSEKHWTVDFRK